MSFVEGMFLLGAVAVAGPLLAHLLARPRYRRVPFTMIRFLQVGQTQSRSHRHLRNLLLLLLRCAIVILIAMLFARPQWRVPKELDRTHSIHYLGLDNSLSMTYQDSPATNFQRMLTRARDYIREADAEARFHIYALASNDTLNDAGKGTALAYLEQLRPVGGAADLTDYLTGVAEATGGDSAGTVSTMVISDFSPAVLDSFADVAMPVAVDHKAWHCVQSAQPIHNVAVVAAEVAALEGSEISIQVTLANYGEQPQTRRLKAQHQGRELSQTRRITLQPGQRSHCFIEIPFADQSSKAGYLPVDLLLSGEDGLSADDRYYLALSSKATESIQIVLAVRDEREGFLLKTALETLRRMPGGSRLKLITIPYSRWPAEMVRRADILFCAPLTADINDHVDEIKALVSRGGRLIAFMSADLSPQQIEPLIQAGLLPAIPKDYRRQETHLSTLASSPASASGFEEPATLSLARYALDKVMVWGFFDCQVQADSVCPWYLQNGTGFLYRRTVDQGRVFLVNTSSDDAMGELMKSSAVLPFCKHLLGLSEPVREHTFVCGESVSLPASLAEMNQADAGHTAWAVSPSGAKVTATLLGNHLWPQLEPTLGWVRSVGKPVRWAGINAPAQETNLARTDEAMIAVLMDRVFPGRITQRSRTSTPQSEWTYRSLVKMFAGTILALILLQAFIANRVKR